jgi:hypothetical protein
MRGRQLCVVCRGRSKGTEHSQMVKDGMKSALRTQEEEV